MLQKVGIVLLNRKKHKYYYNLGAKTLKVSMIVFILPIKEALKPRHFEYKNLILSFFFF